MVGQRPVGGDLGTGGDPWHYDRPTDPLLDVC